VNRHARRAAAAKTPRSGTPDEKCAIAFHCPPEDFSQKHLAMFLTACSYVWSIATGKVPGEVTYPIHVAIEMDGKKLCGHIEPATGEAKLGSGANVIHTCSSTQ
jgi:hypothetical protein